MFATQLIYIFLPRPSSLLLFKVWRLWCGTYYVGFGCSIVSPYFPLYFFSLLLKAWRPWRGTYNVVNIMVFRGLPQAYGDYFLPPSQGLKTMAWHLQCWLQYSATEPRGCISERFSAPGATALVPRHRKSACKSSLRRQICSPTAPWFSAERKIHVKNLPSSRHSQGRSCSSTDPWCSYIHTSQQAT